MSDWLPFSYFKRLKDWQLVSPYATFAYSNNNVANANRECRRRAAKGGYGDVYEWLSHGMERKPNEH